MTNDLYTAIDTTSPTTRLVVDKYDNNEVWVAMHVRQGHVYCVVNFEQAREMIAALQRVLDSEKAPSEVAA